MNDVWTTVILPVVAAAVLGIAGYLGTQLKGLMQRHADEKTKISVARTVVLAVEQIYKDLCGEEKKQKAIEGIRQMLDENGIPITELEINMLLEAAVAEFNDAFNQPRPEPTD